MSRRLTAIVQREGNGYVAQCAELDVASQGDTVTEARDNLAEALTLFFETAPAEEVARRLRSEVYVTSVEVAVGSAARSIRSRGLSNSNCPRSCRGQTTWQPHCDAGSRRGSHGCRLGTGSPGVAPGPAVVDHPAIGRSFLQLRVRFVKRADPPVQPFLLSASSSRRRTGSPLSGSSLCVQTCLSPAKHWSARQLGRYNGVASGSVSGLPHPRLPSRRERCTCQARSLSGP